MNKGFTLKINHINKTIGINLTESRKQLFLVACRMTHLHKNCGLLITNHSCLFIVAYLKELEIRRIFYFILNLDFFNIYNNITGL